jgi:hypothetical protein
MTGPLYQISMPILYLLIINHIILSTSQHALPITLNGDYFSLLMNVMVFSKISVQLPVFLSSFFKFVQLFDEWLKTFQIKSG